MGIRKTKKNNVNDKNNFAEGQIKIKKYNKIIDKDITEIDYQIKGDPNIINFIKDEFFVLITYLSEDIGLSFTKNSYGKEIVMFYQLGISEFFHMLNENKPNIDIIKIDDDFLNIKLSLFYSDNNYFSVHVLRIVEMILKIVDKSKDMIMTRMEKINKILLDDEFVTDVDYPSFTDIILNSGLVNEKKGDDSYEYEDDNKQLLKG